MASRFAPTHTGFPYMVARTDPPNHPRLFKEFYIVRVRFQRAGGLPDCGIALIPVAIDNTVDWAESTVYYAAHLAPHTVAVKHVKVKMKWDDLTMANFASSIQDMEYLFHPSGERAKLRIEDLYRKPSVCSDIPAVYGLNCLVFTQFLARTKPLWDEFSMGRTLSSIDANDEIVQTIGRTENFGTWADQVIDKLPFAKKRNSNEFTWQSRERVDSAAQSGSVVNMELEFEEEEEDEDSGPGSVAGLDEVMNTDND